MGAGLALRQMWPWVGLQVGLGDGLGGKAQAKGAVGCGGQAGDAGRKEGQACRSGRYASCFQGCVPACPVAFTGMEVCHPA